MYKFIKIICYFSLFGVLFISDVYSKKIPQQLLGPKIKMEADFFNLGTIRKGEVIEKSFWVENAGDEDLVIEAVFTACGCTHAEMTEKIIAVKKKAALKIIYNSEDSDIGVSNASIYILSNDRLNSRFKFTIEVKIIE